MCLWHISMLATWPQKMPLDYAGSLGQETKMSTMPRSWTQLTRKLLPLLLVSVLVQRYLWYWIPEEIHPAASLSRGPRSPAYNEQLSHATEFFLQVVWKTLGYLKGVLSLSLVFLLAWWIRKYLYQDCRIKAFPPTRCVLQWPSQRG